MSEDFLELAHTVKSRRDVNEILESEHEFWPLPWKQNQVEHLKEAVQSEDTALKACITFALDFLVVLETIGKSEKETYEEKWTFDALILTIKSCFGDVVAHINSSLVNVENGLIVVSVKVSWNILNLFLTFPG